MTKRPDDAKRADSAGSRHRVLPISRIGLRDGHAAIARHLDEIERILRALPVQAPAELFDLVVQLRAKVNRALAGDGAADPTAAGRPDS